MGDRHRGGRRTDYAWSSFGDVQGGQDLGAAGASFGSQSLGFTTVGTINRLRGRVGATLDTGGVDESAIILCGLAVFPADTTTAPEIFGDGTDDEWSWIWQGSLYVTSGAEAAVVTERLSATIEIDSKAMRRVKPDWQLRFVHEPPIELVVDQTGTYDLTYFVHVLKGS